MQIQENISLRSYNTFGIDTRARFFSSFSETEELQELLTSNSRLPTIILGGGSNILFTRPVSGLVLHNRISGIRLSKEDDLYNYVT